MSIPGLPTHFDNTLGAIFIGCITSGALFGVSISQTFVFYQSYPYERAIIKYSVAVLALLSTLHLAFAGHTFYWWAVHHFADPLGLFNLPWSLWAGTIVATLTDSIIRIFFTFRLWKLSRENLLLICPLVIVNFVVLVVGLATALVGIIKIHTAVDLAKFLWLPIMGSSLFTFGDIWFTFWLSYYLLKSRRDLKPVSRPSRFDGIMALGINTGALAGLASLSSLILCVSLQSSLVFLAVFLPWSKLYINAYLATLNTRTFVSAGLDNAKVPLTNVNGTAAIPVAFADILPEVVEIGVHQEVIKASA